MQGQKPKRSDPNQIRLTPGSIFQLFSWNAEAFFRSLHHFLLNPPPNQIIPLSLEIPSLTNGLYAPSASDFPRIFPLTAQGEGSIF